MPPLTAPPTRFWFAASSVVAIAVLGVFFTLLVSAFLSKTLLRGEASSFSLELPPYRPPQIWQTLYRSIIDRTLIILKRAVADLTIAKLAPIRARYHELSGAPEAVDAVVLGEAKRFGIHVQRFGVIPGRSS